MSAGCLVEQDRTKTDDIWATLSRWVDQTRACLICPALKANAAWELDCNYTCLSNYYGKAEFDNCTSCPEYRQMLGTALPMNAYFPSTGTACGAGDWYALHRRNSPNLLRIAFFFGGK
jgi:hypothetical protein